MSDSVTTGVEAVSGDTADGSTPVDAPRDDRVRSDRPGRPRAYVVIDNPNSWFFPYARRLVRRLSRFTSAGLLSSAAAIPPGNDIAFFLSYERLVTPDILARSRHNIVVHASALPKGKGMSPLTWQILNGENTIPLTLFEAVEALDAGPVYLESSVTFDGSELLDEIRAAVGTEIIDMCLAFVRAYPAITDRGRAQEGPETRYRLRTPEDSRLDPAESLAAQFNLLRVVDNQRYPAFFDWRGHRYVITIKRAKRRDSTRR